DDHLGLLLVELGLCDADSLVEVLVRQGRVDDFVAVVFQKRRLDAAWNRLPTVEKEDFHRRRWTSSARTPSACRVESKALLVWAANQWSFYGLTACGRLTRPPHFEASRDDGGSEPERQHSGQRKGGQHRRPPTVMRAMSKQREGRLALCPYCGLRPGKTKDHVIPQSLFPKPLPNGINLPTVKACAECNNVRKSGDDTFLRDF